MNVIAPPEYEGPEDELSVIAACLSAWPSCYRMGEHDTNVCRKASAALVEIGQMQTILQDIASQSKSDEFGDDREDADFEGAYDIMIQLARSVTTKDTRNWQSKREGNQPAMDGITDDTDAIQKLLDKDPI